jgi:3-(3-hydroxy-phenyl)propionate hydroxylase
MRFVTHTGHCFASIEPRTDEFGWSRRNAFIQPLADRVLYEGLRRFPHVEVLFGNSVSAFTQDQTGVTIETQDHKGGCRTILASYMVGADGGNSFVRRVLDVPFEGRTKPNQWIVVDVRNDPIGSPHVYMHCDPKRPYVSAALPHGIRRFEFMVMPGETEEELSKPENLAALIRKVVADPEKVDYIRKRVYTHNARLASSFRVDRVLLAGDAAHIMPVWQGQGYNSGMRDASNLAWKLSLVIKGLAADSLLDSYEQERRDHAKAMIDLSVLAGHVLAPPKRWQGMLRDGVSWLLNYVPPVKRYFVEMRFKPMPQYTQGALIVPSEKGSPVGKMFIQPRVLTEAGETVLLDEVIGENFAIIAWGCDPTWGLTAAQIDQWQALGTRFIQILPDVQLQATSDVSQGVIRIGDSTGRLKEWFARGSASIALVRPDRFLAGLAIPQTVGRACDELALAIKALPQPEVAIPASKVA